MLEATLTEWNERLLPELQRVQSRWFHDAEALLVTSVSVTASVTAGEL